MAAIVFPTPPLTVGQTFTPAGGPTYQWSGTTWVAGAGINLSGYAQTTGWTANQVLFGNASGTMSQSANFGYNDTSKTLSVGSAGTAGSLALFGSTSGSITLAAPATASGTITFPSGPATLLAASASLTTGSALFADSSGNISQDNANYFWDNTNKRLGVGTATPAAQFYVAKNSAGAISALGNQTGSVTIDMSTANNFSMVLTGSVTLANPSNMTPGQTGAIYLTQDATGGRTVAYGANWDFPSSTAPTASTAANAVDVLVYTVRSASSIAAQLLTNIG